MSRVLFTQDECSISICLGRKARPIFQTIAQGIVRVGALTCRAAFHSSITGAPFSAISFLSLGNSINRFLPGHAVAA